jgi:hypothetical protein
MVNAEQYFLAFLVAFIFAMTELLSTKYPMTFYFLKKSPSLYGYAIAYGLFSVFFFYGLDSFGFYSCLITPIFGNVWVQAAATGLITKALLHVSVFRADSVPIGLETLVYIFEPGLLRQIALDEYDGRQKFIIRTQANFPDLDDVLARINQNIPRVVDRELAETFIDDLDYKLFVEYDGESDETKINFAMDFFLVTYGMQSFKRAFP